FVLVGLAGVGLAGTGMHVQGASVDAPPGGPASGAKESDNKAAAGPKARDVAQLIEQLGDPQYHTREKAQEELQRVGMEAFDALLAAQEHADVEIAMRSRYLVRSMSVEWTKDADPAEVKQLFRDYGNRDRDERATRAQHFAALPDAAGIDALCRIMRFDVDRVLSKEAAVLILNSAWPEDAAERARRAQRIREEVAGSTRKGADWLRLYARSLETPAETESEWGQAIRSELNQLARQPQDSDRKLTTDLIRWHTRLLLRLDRRDDALVSIRRTIDLLGEGKAELYEMLDWCIENGLHATADELAARFPMEFGDDPKLLYLLAESQLNRGDRGAADMTADRARALAPGLDKLNYHLTLASFLQRRLRMDWAEQELRLVVERTAVRAPGGGKTGGSNEVPPAEPGVPPSYHECFGPSRWGLSELLFDTQRELEAAEMAKSLIDVAGKTPAVLEFLQDPELGHLQGYMHYYYAQHYAKTGDRAKQREYARKAIQDWPENPDFIIAMYRVPDVDEAWQKDVRDRIERFSGEMLKEIRVYEMVMQQPMNEEERSRNGEALAGRLNEFAWLISNTEGDKQEALKASKRSLELRPNSYAYLDTLGRCYYSVGDFENAVRAQKRAVQLMPSMMVMQRQLQLFEQALAESRGRAGGSG
ncbi:MAG: hypothetical protein AB7O38_29790, partial [Pirellulaceae bacterium]